MLNSIAVELVIFFMDAPAQGSLGVEYRWTLSGVCQADAETGEISAPTYVTGGLAATLPRRFAFGTNVPPVSHLLLTGMSLDGRIHGRLLKELPLLQQLDLRSNRSVCVGYIFRIFVPPAAVK